MGAKEVETFKKRWNELHEKFLSDSEEKDDARKDDAYEQKKDFLVRLRRSISWLRRAQQMRMESKGTGRDLDTQFIFLWISFNALYARDPHELLGGKKKTEMGDAQKYFGNLLNFGHDAKGRIYKVIKGNIEK